MGGILDATGTMVPASVPAPLFRYFAAHDEARGLACRAEAACVQSRNLRDQARRTRLAARDHRDRLRFGIEEARRSRATGHPSAPGHRPAVTRPVAAGGPEYLLDLHTRYAAAGDQACRTELAAAYDSFALAMARRFPSRRETPEDLAQVARVGLLYALDRFDPARGLPFAPFARATIVGELKRHVRDRSWSMRVPRPLQEQYLAVVRALEELTQELGRSPRIPELAARAGLTDEQVLEAVELADAQYPLSLDGPAGDTDGPMFDPGWEDSAYGAVDRRAVLDVLLARLPDREREVLRLRFVEELTQAEIAKHLGVSQMTISRLLARVLVRLRTRYQRGN